MVKIETLRASELFSELGDEDLQKIIPLCREEHHAKGAYIFSKGEEANMLYILQEGKVSLEYEVCPQPDACQDTTIVVDQPGDVIGWSALVRPRRLTASARCISDVRLIAIEGKAMNGLMEQDSHIGFVVMKKLAEVISKRLRQAKGLKLDRVMGAL
ncbi:MAG: cyclic nucleotide-binding domain-containing protein [Chloroflexi bacterium]|nr:cyclic nucleotide-binding domain-containing protein [Chloroflexota bacterium]